MEHMCHIFFTRLLFFYSRTWNFPYQTNCSTYNDDERQTLPSMSTMTHFLQAPAQPSFLITIPSNDNSTLAIRFFFHHNSASGCNYILSFTIHVSFLALTILADFLDTSSSPRLASHCCFPRVPSRPMRSHPRNIERADPRVLYLVLANSLLSWQHVLEISCI